MNRHLPQPPAEQPASPHTRNRNRQDNKSSQRRESDRQQCPSVMDMLSRTRTTDTTKQEHETSPLETRRSDQTTKITQFCPTPDHHQSPNPQPIEQDLLISCHSLTGDSTAPPPSITCPIHNKTLDIICKIDRVKICAHCALFGSHKDHTFQQESEFLEELRRRELKLMELRRTRETLERNQYLEQQWTTVEMEIRARENEQIGELREEYAALVKKITNVKEEIEQQIKAQYAAALEAFRVEADACKSEIRYSRSFDRWSSEGKDLLDCLRNHFNSGKFNASYKDYENFAWKTGEMMLKEMQERVERVKNNAEKTAVELKGSLNQISLLAHFTGALQLTQIHSNSQLDTSITSLDDIHRTLFAQNFNLASQNEFLEAKEMYKHRNSECLEKVLSPIAEAGSRLGSAKMVKSQQKLTASFLSPDRKKENNPLSHSMMNTTLHKAKSTGRMENSVISPKNKSRVYRSPEAAKAKPDPMKIVKEYEKRAELTELNLSECELTDDSLVYFLEKAMNSHIPSILNLEKNQLTMAGLSKYMPYLAKCRSVNLSRTGLGEGCLDWLIKSRSPFAIEELNLTGNGVSVKKCKGKLELLMKCGLKIRCD